MNSAESYPDHQRWHDGSIQELIPENGETFRDAINFMRDSLKQYGHDDLTFSEEDVESVNGKYYITLKKVIPDVV